MSTEHLKWDRSRSEHGEDLAILQVRHDGCATRELARP